MTANNRRLHGRLALAPHSREEGHSLRVTFYFNGDRGGLGGWEGVVWGRAQGS